MDISNRKHSFVGRNDDETHVYLVLYISYPTLPETRLNKYHRSKQTEKPNRQRRLIKLLDAFIRCHSWVATIYRCQNF
jgi:hypothetical protein